MSEIMQSIGLHSGRGQLCINSIHPAGDRFFSFARHTGGHEIDVVAIDDVLSGNDQRPVSIVKIDVKGPNSRPEADPA